MKKVTHTLRAARTQPRHIQLALFALIFAAIGVIFLALTRAAGPTISIEPEKGQKTLPLVVENDSSASGGENISFGISPPTPPASGPRGTVAGVPATGALFGMFTDGARGSGVPRIQEKIGRRLDLRMQFIDFKTGGGGLLDLLNKKDERGNDIGFITEDLKAGRMPVISWQAATWNGGLGENFMGDIAAGKYDWYFDAVGKKLASYKTQYNVPIHMRFAHEMNGFWYGWSKASTAQYKDAWRRAVTRFRAQGATNVVWNWCPFGINFPNDGGKPFADYYPGDDYVDVVGIDIYAEQPGQTMGDVLSNGAGSVYATYKSKKPIFIMESMSGPRGGDKFQDKTNYFNQMVNVLKNKFPDISGIVLFDENKLQGENADFSIEKTSNPTANVNNMNAYSNMAKNCYFGSDARQKSCKGL